MAQTTTRPSRIGLIQWIIRVTLCTSATGVFFAGAIVMVPRNNTHVMGLVSGFLGLCSAALSVVAVCDNVPTEKIRED